jgi:hypothetical protein
MNSNPRARWAAVIFLVSIWGLVLRGSVSPEYSAGPAVTVTVSPGTSTPSPSSPVATPSPGVTPGAGGSGSGTGHGTGGGSPFGITGDVGGLLQPGETAPLDLTLSNPNDRPIRVTSLSVAIASVTAPHATVANPCGVSDFAVAQLPGAASFTIPAHSSRTLATLGLAPAQMPSLSMITSAANQDGCKGATVRLSYGGTAVWGDA